MVPLFTKSPIEKSNSVVTLNAFCWPGVGARKPLLTAARTAKLSVNANRPDTLRRLFVIDGSKALRKAIEKVFGQRHPIQRCRNHKLRNVLGHLPKDQHPQVKAAFRAAMKLDAKQGEQKLEQLARWLERDHPSASASLREGLSEMFTINRLGLPPRLRKCLGSTNLIDSTHSGVRQKTRRVTNWKNGAMALRWAAASFVETEKSYRRIIGYDQLWMLRAHLDDHEPVAEMRKAG